MYVGLEDSSEHAAMQDPEGAGPLDVGQATAGNRGPDMPPGGRAGPRRRREDVYRAPAVSLGRSPATSATGVWRRPGGDAVSSGQARRRRALKIQPSGVGSVALTTRPPLRTSRACGRLASCLPEVALLRRPEALGRRGIRAPVVLPDGGPDREMRYMPGAGWPEPLEE